MIWRAAALLLLALSACAELPPLSRNVCGNRILEPGEQCDGDSELGRCGVSGTPNACSLVCEGGASCPSGWGCGRDQRCRQRSGVLAAGERVELRGAFELADLDGDGVSDLLAPNQGLLELAYGVAGGVPSQKRQLGVPYYSVPPVIADLDGDGRSDLVVPVPEGLLFLRGKSDRTLESVANTPLRATLSNGAALRLVCVTRHYFFVDIIVPLLATATRIAVPGAPYYDVPTGYRLDAAPARVAQAFIPGYDTGGDTLALAFASADRVVIATATNTTYVNPITGQPGPTIQLIEAQNISLPLSVRSGAWFGDMDGDGALDLLISIADTPGTGLLVAYGNPASGGRFNSPVCPFLAAHASFTSEVVEAPLLAVGDLNGDGVADLITPDGVQVSITPAPRCGVPSSVNYRDALLDEAAWTEAVIGDFNGDGLADAAALTRRNTLVLATQSRALPFNPREIVLDGEPAHLVVGDYDGDAIDDVVFALRTPGRPDELYTVFGAREGAPPPPSSQGAFDAIDDLCRLSSVLTASSLDGISDLGILGHTPGETNVLAAIARGSSNRRLYAPLFLRGITEVDAPQPRAVVAGELCSDCPHGPDCPSRPDLLLFTEHPATGEEIFLVRGSADGDPSALSNTSLDSAPLFADLPALCQPLLVSGDLDGDGFDEVIAADGSTCPARNTPVLVTFRPAGVGTGCLSRLGREVQTLPGSVGPVRALALADLDADGDLDLLLQYDGSAEERPGVRVLFNEAGRLVAPGVVVPVPGRDVASVTALELDDTPGLELALVLADAPPMAGSLAISHLVLPDYRYEVVEVVADAPLGQHIASADFNQDGLFDLAVGDGQSVHFFMGQDGARP